MSLWLRLADASGIIGGSASQACGSSCNTGTTVGSVFTSVSNVLIFLVGAVSVIMIILGALKYVMSQGDAKAAADGKNTILYAVIGIVVAIASFAIVNFVIKNIK